MDVRPYHCAMLRRWGNTVSRPHGFHSTGANGFTFVSTDKLDRVTVEPVRGFSVAVCTGAKAVS